MDHGVSAAHALIRCRMQDALDGDAGACFDLGVAHSVGKGMRIDLVEAYKWFTLAALAGYEFGPEHSAKTACKMSARELGEARRRALLLLKSKVQVARFSASAFD